MQRIINILLVDDVEYTRDLLRGAINACIDASDLPLEPKFLQTSLGRRALKMITETSIDILFLDIELPDLNGITILREVKDTSPSTYTVMVSGESSSENVVESIKYGANGFIAKPFNTERIQESLLKFLKHGKYH